MLYYLIVHCVPNFRTTPLRLIDYVTFRAGVAALTAMLLVLLLGPLTVKLLKRFRTAAPARLAGLVPEKFIDHNKDKTPSMGGLLIVFAIGVSMLLWANLANPLALIFLGTLISLSALGFCDDFSKLIPKKKKGTENEYVRGGISGKTKLFFQILIALLALFSISRIPGTGAVLREFCVPFVKEPVWIMPAALAFVFGSLVVIGSSNAVNLTDGKDGLAVGCVIFCTLTYATFAYVSGHKFFAEYLNVNFVRGAGEVGVFASCIAGACIGFLWYNCHPASMFMGDTGSLALGGSIGLIAVLVKQELLLLLVGWVFVMEAGSVILQVASMKTRKKRIFLCTPIHHHFEQKGWPETQIVVRFWIIAGVCALIGLATLKLR